MFRKYGIRMWSPGADIWNSPLDTWYSTEAIRDAEFTKRLDAEKSRRQDGYSEEWRRIYKKIER